MSIPDRLFALTQQYRDQYGAAALADAGRMVPHLSSQAPDLHEEVRALAAAIAQGAAQRIISAPDPQAEAQAVIQQIAGAQMLSVASVTAAIDVARRLNISAGRTDGWAGETVPVGRQPTPSFDFSAPYPPQAPSSNEAKPPIWQNKWAIGAAGAALLLIGYQQFGQQPAGQDAGAPQAPAGGGPNAPVDPNAPADPNAPTGPNAPTNPNTPTGPNAPVVPPGPPPKAGGPGAPSAGGQQFPALASPNGPQPTLMVQSTQNGFMVGFSLNGVAGMVSAPPGGWDNGNGGVMFSRNPQSNQPDAVGGGRFQRVGSAGSPARVMQVQWQQDNLGLGPTCVAFIGNGGQDVNPRGARMCIMDGACNRPVGCGQLPAGQ